MDYKTLSEKLAKYTPAIKLEKIIPSGWRKFLKTASLILTLVFLFVSVASTFYQTIPAQIFQGLAEITCGLWLLFFCLDAFQSSLYFDDLPLMARETFFKNPEMPGSFLTALAVSGKGANLSARLFKSSVGKMLAMRLEIPANERPDADVDGALSISNYNAATFSINPDGENLFEEFISALYHSDKSFADFLFKYAVREKELRGAGRWLSEKSEKEKRKQRFWGRDNLGRVPGIGKDWSYGQTYALQKYGGRLEEVFDFGSRGLGSHTKEVSEIESILSRQSEGNILLVADDDLEKEDIVVEFCKKIYSGKTLPALEHKVIFVLNIGEMAVAGASKDSFEKEFLAVMNEAERAENIILFVTDLPGAISAATALGSDVLSLMNPYMSSSVLQIIAGSDIKNFHQRIENNITLSEKFEKIILNEDDEDSLVGLLEERADDLEERTGVFFSYPAILEIAQNASRYFTGQVISDKALDILLELPQIAAKHGRNVVTKKDVAELTETKTGVPTGEIVAAEKDKLLNLEKILHERIIGQDEAVSAIASALRRARSGIESKNRPLGSFLFLGPTGVGKTETTKALAEVFFGDEKKIMRLDMSEYSGDNSLRKLIGSFESGKIGTLTSLLRENQYGVLLLDEFEKAEQATHDLFLQILDEGIFSDMLGKKVNARNLIIIATSNAGSDIIWDFVKQQKDLAENKQTIIDAIIHQGVFRPELLNRFDGVILFHPLDEKLLKQVATLMLERLAKRLEEKSLKLRITDELVNYLVKIGSDPAFGARPINRAIQDQVEEVIAKKLIAGDIKPGSEVVLTETDLQK
jgi:ATP-dependent Clp protease ATP-binding subunit ClpA